VPSGQTTPTPVMATSRGAPRCPGVIAALGLSAAPGGGRLTGTSWFVQDAQKVDGFIVAAKSVAAKTDAGMGLYYVDAGAVAVQPDRIVDLSRDQGRIVLNDAPAEVIAEPGRGQRVLADALPALLTLVAADIAGAAVSGSFRDGAIGAKGIPLNADQATWGAGTICPDGFVVPSGGTCVGHFLPLP